MKLQLQKSFPEFGSPKVRNIYRTNLFVGRRGEGGNEEVDRSEQMPQLEADLLDVVEVLRELPLLHALRQGHHSSHHRGRRLVHRVVRPVQLRRRGRLQLLQKRKSYFLLCETGKPDTASFSAIDHVKNKLTI